MSFNGLESWHDNFPKVDFQTSTGLLDLHNNAILERACFLVANATLVLGFQHSQDWRKIESSGRQVDLEFGDVTDLRIVQVEDYDARSADTLEGVTRLGESRFIIDAGDMKFEFNAQSVTLRMR